MSETTCVVNNKSILIAGDVKGNFKPLLKRLNKFDFAICVGETLAIGDQLSELLSGKQEIPRPIYFIDNGPLMHFLNIKYPKGGELVKNLIYLGHSGLKEIEGGFKTFFVSGKEDLRKYDPRTDENEKLMKNCNFYTETELVQKAEELTKQPEFNGIDFLLTSEWPSNIEEEQNSEPKKDSEILSNLAF